MRKSSLGRRSSTQIPVRIPSLGASGTRTSGGKRSGIKQPGFTQTKYRSQSEDRESYSGASTMVRSNTVSTLPGRNLGAMTPITPRQNVHSNLPTGSVRAPRSQTMSTESNRRMSSFGGTKSVRKDSRPISEKAFQQSAQTKVEQYIESYGSNILGPGSSIRPMNTKLFVDLMDFLLTHFDSRIVITKSNYLEEIPLIMRKLGYRSKIDRSWLMTVNTPHSWQHVIAILSWLVEAIECMNCVDPFELMYTNNIPEPEGEEDDEAIDKELILHLKKTYRLVDEGEESNAAVERLNAEFIEKQIVDLKCTDEDFETLQREIDLVKEELDNEVGRRDLQLEVIEKLKEKHDAVLADYQAIQKFLEESKEFVSSTENKMITCEKEISVKRSILAKKQDELQKLQEKVNSQQISMDEKDKLTKEKHDLLRMIQFYENGIREYEKSAFSVDLKFAEDQRKLEKLIVEYNKLVAEKIIVEPRLKDVEVKFTLISKADDALMNVVDDNLKNLKEENKNSLHTLETKKEESENILWRVKQDKQETQEEIAKETALLEGVECDLEKQEELINKETQKFKDEIKRYQVMTKEIVEEMSDFDEAKLVDKKLELKKIEHDWDLVQERTKRYMEEEMEIAREVNSKIGAEMKKLSERAIQFENKFGRAEK